MGRTGQVVVVTGASAGVGRAVARAFGDRQAKIGLLARGAAGLDGTVVDIERAGGQALAVPTDMADPDAVTAAAQRVEDAFGPIDVWVNNAFTVVFGQVWDLSPAEFRRVTEVTYLGYVYGTLAALNRMMPRDSGAIVQVGSALAYRGIPLQSAYCAAKHAIVGFTESLRTELLHQHSGVRVTMVHLPAMNTPQFGWVRSKLPREAQPVPPIYQPELAARAVLRAAGHPGRREYWIGGMTAATVLGNRVAPGLLDRYLARTGYESQQTATPREESQPDNLCEPVDERSDHGAHGQFDARAHRHSPQAWASKHHGVLAAAAGATSLAGLIGLGTRIRRG